MSPRGLDVGRCVSMPVVAPRQEDTAFQILESALEFDAPMLAPRIERFDDVLGRHGPSMGKTCRSTCDIRTLILSSARQADFGCSCDITMSRSASSVPPRLIF